MVEPGLRERKKLRTRAHIAECAARLFAEHGYEQVSVRDVAAAAEVSEQTVYNYFPAKRDLVLDRDAQLRETLAGLVSERPAGVSPAAAIRPAALALCEEIRGLDDDALRGGLGYLGTRSPAVRRLSLEMTDGHADAIAAALTGEELGLEPAAAKLHAVALAWVIQTITDETGRRTAAGETPAQIADALGALVERLLFDLERWPLRR